MKINSINNINNNYNKPSFKRTAVPYPEYKTAYIIKAGEDTLVSSIKNKINEIFRPDVTKEALNIKNQIDSFYGTQEADPKQHLLTVFA